MPDSPLGRISYPGLGSRPILAERPRVRDVGGTLYCGRQVQICTDVFGPCIFDEFISAPSFPPPITGDGLAYKYHAPSPWFDDESSFHPCAPSQLVPNLPVLPTPSFTNIPSNCQTNKEPRPGDNWEQNWVGTGGISLTMFPDVPNAKYTPRKCWRCISGCSGGSTVTPPDIVVKREPPKIEYSRIPIDLNMIYEINESEKGYPTQKWTLDPDTIASGLGPQPGASNNPMTIHYPCPIYGKKSISKICKIKQLASGDLLDMRQFSWGTAPFVSTEITRLTALPPIPGQPKFTNASNYKYVPTTGAAFSYTFTVAEVIDPAINVKIKKV